MKINPHNYNRFCEAVAKVNDFVKSGKATCKYDDPRERLTYHSMLITLLTDEFNTQTEIKEFTEILNLFDGFMFVVSSDGEITLSLIINNVYE